MLKNITLSADEDLIETARAVAAAENKTLNQVFREWLEHYQSRANSAVEYKNIMNKLSGVRVGEMRFTREELNSRN